MRREELKRTLSLDYKYVGKIIEIEDKKYKISLFSGKEIAETKTFDDAIRLIKIKTAALQEISPIPCAIAVRRKNRRLTYMLFPSVDEAPSIELPSYHFIRTNAAVTNSSYLRLSKHVNPNAISFNDLARVILFEKTKRYIWNIIVSSLTMIGVLALMLSLIIFPFLSKDLKTTAEITDHPIFTPESLISTLVFVFFAIVLSFLSVASHISFRRNLRMKSDGSSFEAKTWWKQYNFKTKVNRWSRMSMVGIVISTTLSAYFWSDTVYMNAYFVSGPIITGQKIIFYTVASLVTLMIFTIEITIVSNRLKRRQYLKSYIEPDYRPLFDAWGKSSRIKDMKFEFNYDSYRFKPTNEIIAEIDNVFAQKSKLTEAEKHERKDWMETNYKKALNIYLTKKRRLNRKSRI